MLARIRDLNRLELAGGDVRAAVETLAAAAPGWLAAVIDASWQQVYGQRAGNLRLPEAQAAREQAIGAWRRAIPVHVSFDDARNRAGVASIRAFASTVTFRAAAARGRSGSWTATRGGRRGNVPACAAAQTAICWAACLPGESPTASRGASIGGEL